MKALSLALCFAASAYGVSLANESRHAAIVDMPEVVNLAQASPDTWRTLPPVPNEPPASTAATNLDKWPPSTEVRRQLNRGISE
jgi:hypothetical protein